eukprot:6214698-Pleurochrysis_carterae.AAC.2
MAMAAASPPAHRHGDVKFKRKARTSLHVQHGITRLGDCRHERYLVRFIEKRCSYYGVSKVKTGCQLMLRRTWDFLKIASPASRATITGTLASG